jgi:glycosyltransferase involved in cell wall biosynthesis
MLVIPNGFDLKKYLPDNKVGQEVRSELLLDSGQLIVGMVARYHPMKGFAPFISAAGQLALDNLQVTFVLCGSGVTWDNDTLVTMIDEAGLRDRFKLLGPRTDVARLLSAFDLFTSPSLCGEGFSNVVGEAMCCGVPCVVTDVGDSAWIVGTTGRVIPPDSPGALADAWRELLCMSQENRHRLGVEARSRMQENFSLSRITDQYQELFLTVCDLEN